MSEVKRAALGSGLAIDQPATLRDSAVLSRLSAAKADVMVVAAYGLILPPVVLDVTPRGCINIHASLLPRWRGAAPIQHALLAGDRETGVSIMQMDAGLDTGPVLLERRLPIAPDDTTGTLQEKLATVGSEAIVAALAALEHGTLVALSQPESGVTYAHKVSKEEARLDWRRPASELERCVRAYNPAPGAYTTLGGQTLKIWQARAEEQSAAVFQNPGDVTVSADGTLRIVCGRGILGVTELQRAGGRRLDVAEFLRGNPISLGTRLGI
jgi:methionyl-tRNA formyltransferase